MPTKRTRTTTEKPAAQPAEETITTTQKPEPVLPKSIDLIADAVSEMLTTGTSEDNLNNLLITSISHITRRTYEGFTQDESTIRQGINRDVKELFRPWKIDVMTAWKKARREDPTTPDPKTVSERIRANVREDLEDRFERFLRNGTPEEMRFLLEVFMDHESACSVDPASFSAEMGLGKAFDYTLGRHSMYIRVPEYLGKKVDTYVQALLEVEGKAA